MDLLTYIYNGRKEREKEKEKRKRKRREIERKTLCS